MEYLWPFLGRPLSEYRAGFDIGLPFPELVPYHRAGPARRRGSHLLLSLSQKGLELVECLRQVGRELRVKAFWSCALNSSLSSRTVFPANMLGTPREILKAASTICRAVSRGKDDGTNHLPETLST